MSGDGALRTWPGRCRAATDKGRLTDAAPFTHGPRVCVVKTRVLENTLYNKSLILGANCDVVPARLCVRDCAACGDGRSLSQNTISQNYRGVFTAMIDRSQNATDHRMPRIFRSACHFSTSLAGQITAKVSALRRCDTRHKSFGARHIASVHCNHATATLQPTQGATKVCHRMWQQHSCTYPVLPQHHSDKSQSIATTQLQQPRRVLQPI